MCLIAVVLLFAGFIVHLGAAIAASVVATQLKVQMASHEELKSGIITQVWALVFLFDTIYLYCVWCAACLHIQIKRGYFARLTMKPVELQMPVPQQRISA